LSRLERAQLHSVTCFSPLPFIFLPVVLLWHYQEVTELRKVHLSHVCTEIWGGNTDMNQTDISTPTASEIRFLRNMEEEESKQRK